MLDLCCDLINDSDVLLNEHRHFLLCFMRKNINYGVSCTEA